jgi:hypothetical protein
MRRRKMGGELQNAKKILKNLDVMILAIKATGGYKFRQRFQLSDRKIDQLCATSEPAIRKMVVSLIVAEAMLQEPAPSIHPRRDEYIQRRAECMAQLGKK